MNGHDRLLAVGGVLGWVGGLIVAVEVWLGWRR